MNLTKILLVCVTAAVAAVYAQKPLLKIAYSDWPGWTAWEIADKKGFFKKHDVNVKLEWFDYGPSMDAFAAKQVDAVGVANGDAMMLNATGARNSIILINDYSNGNDKIVGAPGINSIKDLKGKKVGVEFGCLSHALLINALTKMGLKESDVSLVNMPTHQAVQTLESGEVSAVVAWVPHSVNALEVVKGAKELYSSANEPGIIYDVLAVSQESLMKNKAEWEKVVAAWYDVIDFLNDPKNKAEAVKILAARVGISEKKYATFMGGTRFLTAEEAAARFKKGDGYGSVYGSSKNVDAFFVKNKVYEKNVDVNRYIIPSFTETFVKAKK
ncbi:ABC transporter substrate-binding protein [Fibrobacter sp. UWH4]|uniref:ABC transporter substrate-binding protein n=1 Tax=Fibrobacter sp. UWH4 TaxID=1896210 RepID=UPI00091EE483|nr:ABC transporter substrate-binding protein [Fibrobacter sp. UWH4]SHL56380.1 NitT/TauT family transport system substrate-binding protein [Fibrobacter sp. UWH4]